MKTTFRRGLLVPLLVLPALLCSCSMVPSEYPAVGGEITMGLEFSIDGTYTGLYRCDESGTTGIDAFGDYYRMSFTSSIEFDDFTLSGVHLQFPDLSPGVYTRDDYDPLKYAVWIQSWTDNYMADPVTIVIAGSEDGYVWGDITATMSRYTDDPESFQFTAKFAGEI